MSDVTKNSAEKKWGKEISKKFIRLPFELLAHYKRIGLNDKDLALVIWIDFHQWGERAAFPHPAKFAALNNIPEIEVVERLKSLHDRGFIVIEKTRNNSRNYHQDLRPTRNKLRAYLRDNPNHCEPYKNNSLRIDTSIEKDISLNSVSNTSILSPEAKRGGMSSARDILNKYKKKR